jgi:phytoene desaturase
VDSSIEADGFKFDLGPTFFLYPRVLDEIFRRRRYGGNGATRSAIPSSSATARAARDIGHHTREEQIAAIASGDAPGFRRFLDENRTKLRHGAVSETPFLGWQNRSTRGC